MPVAHYRDFIIDYWPKPIPTRAHDYEYAHKFYNGPEDNRCGTAPSLEAAMRAIDEWWEQT